MAATRTSVRRRQRSVPVTVSVTLMSLATAVVLASLPAQSWLWLSIASVAALALGWGALRMMWTEVMQSRHENAADRAAAAAAYSTLFSSRAAEHAEFASAMTERLAEAHFCQRELEGLVTQHETRAQRAEARLAQAHARVLTLEESLTALQRANGDGVADLMDWDEQTTQKAHENAVHSRPALKQA